MLKRLDEAVLQAVSAAASDAVERLGSEQIYGFILVHHIFLICNVSVLTEAQYERLARKHAARSPGRAENTCDRWVPIEYGYYNFREDLFAPVEDLMGPLEGRQQEDEVARIFIRAVRHVREHIITDPQVVLSVMDYAEGPRFEFYAYAELFNDAATLSRLKADLGKCLQSAPFWDELELARSRIPRS